MTRELGDLRRRLLEVINEPSRRSIYVPLREVAAVLRPDGGWLSGSLPTCGYDPLTGAEQEPQPAG